MSPKNHPDNDGENRTNKRLKDVTRPDQFESSSFGAYMTASAAKKFRQLLNPRLSQPQTVTIRKAHPREALATLTEFCPTLRPEVAKQILLALNHLKSFSPAQIRMEQPNGPLCSIVESKRFNVGQNTFQYQGGRIELLIENDPSTILIIDSLRTNNVAPINLDNQTSCPCEIELSFLSTQPHACWKQLHILLQSFGLCDAETILASSDFTLSPFGNTVSAHFNKALTIDLKVATPLYNDLRRYSKMGVDQSEQTQTNSRLDRHWLPCSIQLQGPTDLERIQICNLLRSTQINEIEQSGLMSEAHKIITHKEGLEFDSFWKYNDKLSSTIAIEFTQDSTITDETAEDSADMEDIIDDDESEDVEYGQAEEKLEESGIKFCGIRTSVGTTSIEICSSLHWSEGTISEFTDIEFDEERYDSLPVLKIDLDQLQQCPTKTKLKKGWDLIKQLGKIIDEPDLIYDLKAAILRRSSSENSLDYRNNRVLVNCRRYLTEE